MKLSTEEKIRYLSSKLKSEVKLFQHNIKSDLHGVVGGTVFDCSQMHDLSRANVQRQGIWMKNQLLMYLMLT